MASLLPQSKDWPVCDRRLSRAAREMVKEQILPIVQHYLKDNGFSVAPSVKKTILSRISTETFDRSVGETMSLVIKNTSCPLHPDLDYYSDLEGSVLQSIPGSSKRSPRPSIPYWWKCGKCGRVFATRYYLDLHQMSHHQQQNDDIDNNTTKVCLGSTVCQALSGCDERAFQLEPHYARGSGGAGPDAHITKAEYARRLPICTSDSLKTHRELCIMMMSDCFPNPLAVQLQQFVCEHMSCHGNLHQFVHRHWYSWRDEWEDHYQHHTLGWTGTVLLLGLFFYYAVILVDRLPTVVAKSKRKNIAGHMLLQNDKRANPPSFLVAYYNNKKIKKKAQ